jgi:ABC-type uncharacterized transport system permease subunit
MTDQNDLMLAALFQDGDDETTSVSGPVFTAQVMARVNDLHAKRRVLVDTLVLAAAACVAVMCLVTAPIAWPQIEAAWLKSAAAYGLGKQSLALIGLLLLTGLGWAVAVRD